MVIGKLKLMRTTVIKRVFITKHGLFGHKRMALGLCNAPATFQCAIQFVLCGLTWDKLLAFLDDVII